MVEFKLLLCITSWKSNTKVILYGTRKNANICTNYQVIFVQVTEVIKEHIEGVELGRQHGKEVTYTLPVDSVDKFVGW